MKLPLKVAIAIIVGITGIIIWINLVVLPALDKYIFPIIIANKLDPNSTLFLKFVSILIFGVIPLSILIFLISELVFLKPLLAIHDAIKVIATGNLGLRLKVQGKDEVSEIAKNINTVIINLVNTAQGMANSLRDTLKNEAQLASEKTKVELAKAKEEAFLTSIGDGLVITDTNGKIIFVNNETKKMLGFEDDELLNKSFDEAITVLDDLGNHTAMEERIIYRVTIQAIKFTGKYNFERKDGTILPVSVSVSPVKLNQSISGAVIVFRDITKEKEVDRMKTEFISLASHQLRTPLAAIKWFSELLLEENANEMLSYQQKELAKNISLSTERMIDLVNSLLNISRIESGRLIIAPKLTNVVEMVKQLVNELLVKIKEKNLSLNLDFAPNLPPISLDPKLISQVYLNLLTNAIKYTPNKGYVGLKLFIKDNFLISEISDSGLGIPEKDKPKIFNKFFRAENVTKMETDGTGLGLYLVKSIVEVSRGNIWFQSTEGRGTTFWFSLPLTGMMPKEGEVTLA